MVLDYNKICEITCGAEKIEEKDGFFGFYRFTEEQIEVYKTLKNGDLYNKTFATAGVRLSFVTDSDFVEFEYTAEVRSSRLYAYFDVYENDVLLYHIGEEEVNNTPKHIKMQFSKGKKHIEIYLPWSASVRLTNFTLGDNAQVTGLRRKKKMVCFGDSITQGYDAIYPSLSYVNRLAKFLDADCINKGIGGERFFPELAQLEDILEPDIVTVAYGTNDWRWCRFDEFVQNCKGFLKGISEIYSRVKVFVIAPLWRADGDAKVEMGIRNNEVCEIIQDICRKYPQFSVIDGQKLVPHQRDFFSDKYLHPNDLGFGIYSTALLDKMAID